MPKEVLKPALHPKLIKSLNGEQVFFNKDNTYMVIYTHNGVTSRTQVDFSYRDALKQLIEAHPEKSDKFSKCKFMYNLPYKLCKETGKNRYIDVCMVFVSDWEVGNAICGFNFDGSMRIDIQSHIDISGSEMSIDELIEKRFGQVEPASAEDKKEFGKSYIRVLNKTSKHTTEYVVVSLQTALNHPQTIQILIEKILAHVSQDKMLFNTFSVIVHDLIEAELTKVEPNSDGFIYSIFHLLLIDYIKKKLTRVLFTTDQDSEVSPQIVNIFSFFAHLYLNKAVSQDCFVDFVKDLIKFLQDQSQINLEVLTTLLVAIHSVGSKIKKFNPEVFVSLQAVVNKHGAFMHKVKMADLENVEIDQNLDLNNHITNILKIVNLPPLCFLPPVLLEPKQTEIVRKVVEKNNYECENLEYAGFRPYKGFTKRIGSDQAHNILISNLFPAWVDEKVLFNSMKMFDTSPIPGEFPKLEVIKSGREENKRLIVTFNPDPSCYQDAGFALKMMKRLEIYNKAKTHYTIITFNHKNVRPVGKGQK